MTINTVKNIKHIKISTEKTKSHMTINTVINIKPHDNKHVKNIKHMTINSVGGGRSVNKTLQCFVTKNTQ